MGIWNTWNNSGLGDYIHWRTENYFDHGIYRNFGKSESLEVSIIKAYEELNEVRDMIAKRSNQAQSYKIEAFYNNMLNHNYKEALDNPELTEAEEDEITRFIESNLLEGIEKPVLGDTSNLSFSRSLTSANRITYSGLKNKKTRKVKASTLISIKKQIDENLKILAKNYRVAMQNGIGDKGLIAIAKCGQEFKKIKKQLDVYLKQTDQSLIAFRQENGENNLLGDILTNLDILSKNSQRIDLKDVGIYAENWTAIAGAFGGEAVQKEAGELIKEFTAPGKKESGSPNFIKVSTDFINQEELAQQLTKKAFGKYQWNIEDDGIIISTQTTEDTVDVTIKFKNDKNIFNLKEVSLSVKNYYDPAQSNSEYKKDGIHIISSVPLTIILSLVNSNFSNHYLNLLAAEKNYSSMASKFKKADEFLKYAAAVRALSGVRYQGFKKMSDYFIVNSQKNRHIYVFSTSSLLEYIKPYATHSLDENMIRVKETTWPTVGSLQKVNVFKDTVQERITNIVFAAHEFKLSLSIRPWGKIQ